MRFFLNALLIITCLYLEAKPPQLTPHDTQVKIHEILKAHACHQKLSAPLIQRAIQNYIDELDPAKVYFLDSEIAQWLTAPSALLERVLEECRHENFSFFTTLHQVMLCAITRRATLEKQLSELPLVQDVLASEFKELKWTTTEAQLLERLNRIRSLQFKTAEKIITEDKELFFQRIAKRRLSRESDLIGASEAEREQVILSYVLKSISSALDSQTLYFTPTEANQFMIQIQQRLFGIGALLRDDLNGFSIMRLIEGSPASQSNLLKVGDKIIAIDKESVIGLDIMETVSLIHGPQGSTVELTVLRDNEETLHVPLVRGEIVLKEARFETSFEPYGDGIIATVHLFSFYQDNTSASASDLKAAIEAFKKEHTVKGIILDLRNNSGGLLPQAVAVSALFLSKGIIVSIKDNTDQVRHLRNLDLTKLWDGPLLVLTARTSASAAEIVAQTLQDYGRAFVVGDAETFGKGTFQTFTLESTQAGKVNPKGEYKVTRGRYYTVSGKSPQLVGVKADILVPGPFSSMEIGEKYSKFPLETDQIPPNFHDDLSDVPFMHRAALKKIYQLHAQPILTTYQPHLATLQTNSQLRIKQNTNYQNFLQASAKEEGADSLEFFGRSDLQLIEAGNIMKDLIYLMEKPQAVKKSA